MVVVGVTVFLFGFFAWHSSLIFAFSIEKNIITPDYYKIEGFHPELSEYKFVSIVWVKNNIYRFDLVYPKNDSTKWAKRMETIEEEGMQCN